MNALVPILLSCSSALGVEKSKCAIIDERLLVDVVCGDDSENADRASYSLQTSLNHVL